MLNQLAADPVPPGGVAGARREDRPGPRHDHRRQRPRPETRI